MPDEPTAVEGGQQPQAAPATPEAPPAPPPEPLTKEKIAEFRRNRDPEGLRRAVDAESRRNSGQPPAPAGQPPAPEAPPPPDAGAPPDGDGSAEPKLFHIRFQGEDVGVPDSDNYLGHGSFGRLKKAAAHAAKTLRGYENRVTTAEATASRLARENDELREKLEAAAVTPPAPAQPEPPPTPEPNAGAPAPPVEDIEIPTPPPEPEYSSSDPLDWTAEDREKDAKYRRERAEYDKVMNAAVVNLAKAAKAPAQQGPYNNDPALVAKVEEQGQYIEELKQRDATTAAKNQRTDFWKALADFQDLHKDELATPAPLAELHEEVGTWMNGLAWANGVKPDDPSFEAKKADLVQKYLNGDEAVLENSVAVVPPEGYKQYFRVAATQKRLKRLIADGVLGPKATLQDAWEKDYVSRNLDNDVSALESEAHSNGVRTVLDNLSNVQANTASHIPNSAAAGPSDGEGGGSPEGEISREEAMRILKLPISEVRRDPELMRKRSLIVSRLKTS